MANRQQDYQSTSRQGSRYRSDENDDTRYSRDYEREYGQYRDTDEGDSSVRAGSYDEGRNQGGSSGRYSGYGDFGRGNYGGYAQPGGTQSNYNQEWSGYGQGGGRGVSDEYSRNRGAQQSRYAGQGGYGSQGGYGGQGSFGQGGFGQGSSESGYSRQGWSEPYGEGQQYGYGQRGSQSGGMSGSQYGGSQYGYGGSGQGMHRGKGPKNFQRSDDRIKELICERLTDDPDVDASEVTLNVQGGKITLEGTVDSRQTKMKIEDIADQFATHEVQNNLRVQKQGSSSSESGGKSSMAGSTGKSALSGEDTEQTRQKRN
jgi:osmotically-inducible protein OsmY